MLDPTHTTDPQPLPPIQTGHAPLWNETRVVLSADYRGELQSQFSTTRQTQVPSGFHSIGLIATLPPQLSPCTDQNRSSSLPTALLVTLQHCVNESRGPLTRQTSDLSSLVDTEQSSDEDLQHAAEVFHQLLPEHSENPNNQDVVFRNHKVEAEALLRALHDNIPSRAGRCLLYRNLLSFARDISPSQGDGGLKPFAQILDYSFTVVEEHGRCPSDCRVCFLDPFVSLPL